LIFSLPTPEKLLPPQKKKKKKKKRSKPLQIYKTPITTKFPINFAKSEILFILHQIFLLFVLNDDVGMVKEGVNLFEEKR